VPVTMPPMSVEPIATCSPDWGALLDCAKATGTIDDSGMKPHSAITEKHQRVVFIDSAISLPLS
jgi:hypothetical protein